MSGAYQGATSQPLARLLEQTADAVQAVRGGKSLTDVLARMPADIRPGVQALSFHTLRWLGSATVARERLVPKPPAPNVDALLITALALLWPGEPLPYAEHTLVDQAVTAAQRRIPAAAGFINAVLRRFLRERDAIVQAVKVTPLGAYNHPLWWIDRIKVDWPADWQRLLATANERPPMTLRINARRGTGAAYVQRLAAHLKGATLLEDPALRGQAVVLAEPCPVLQLPGFAEGELSVQDAAAQRAAPLLIGEGEYTLAKGARVLDACAAPGGKTAHLLELAELDLLALDSDPVRLTRVQDTLNRLQLKATLKAGDARDPRGWWDGKPFDAILLDAPARPAASSAATQTCAGCAAPTMWPRWPASRPRCCTRCGRCWRPAGGCCTPPAPSSRPKGSTKSMRFCNAWARARPCCKNSHPAICWPAATIRLWEFPAAALCCRTGFSMP
jgi:16S rRNA (cytosine967-C5)-methyltransferase